MPKRTHDGIKKRCVLSPGLAEGVNHDCRLLRALAGAVGGNHDSAPFFPRAAGRLCRLPLVGDARSSRPLCERRRSGPWRSNSRTTRVSGSCFKGSMATTVPCCKTCGTSLLLISISDEDRRRARAIDGPPWRVSPRSAGGSAIMRAARRLGGSGFRVRADGAPCAHAVGPLSSS